MGRRHVLRDTSTQSLVLATADVETVGVVVREPGVRRWEQCQSVDGHKVALCLAHGVRAHGIWLCTLGEHAHATGVLVHGRCCTFVVAAGDVVRIQDVKVRWVCEGRRMPCVEAQRALDVWLPIQEVEAQQCVRFVCITQGGNERGNACRAQVIERHTEDRRRCRIVHVQGQLCLEYVRPYLPCIGLGDVRTRLERMHRVAVARVRRAHTRFDERGGMCPKGKVGDVLEGKKRAELLSVHRESGMDAHERSTRVVEASSQRIGSGHEVHTHRVLVALEAHTHGIRRVWQNGRAKRIDRRARRHAAQQCAVHETECRLMIARAGQCVHGTRRAPRTQRRSTHALKSRDLRHERQQNQERARSLPSRMHMSHVCTGRDGIQPCRGKPSIVRIQRRQTLGGLDESVAADPLHQRCHTFVHARRDRERRAVLCMRVHQSRRARA